MRLFLRIVVGALSICGAVALLLARRSVFLIGASTVVEDAQGIPEKGRSMLEFIQNQPAVLFYATLLVLLLLGAALLAPQDTWTKSWAMLRERFGRPKDGLSSSGPGKDHNVTSYAQAGGITAHTVHTTPDEAKDEQRKRKEE